MLIRISENNKLNCHPYKKYINLKTFRQQERQRERKRERKRKGKRKEERKKVKKIKREILKSAYDTTKPKLLYVNESNICSKK